MGIPSKDKTLFRKWKDIQDSYNDYQLKDEMTQREAQMRRQQNYRHQLDSFQNNKHEMMLLQKEQDRLELLRKMEDMKQLEQGERIEKNNVKDMQWRLMEKSKQQKY